uniref:Uncharacterized protein n=1 Tax=Anguilla anguilla TaxID=7936 RepID=A0A0E9XA64_ANGAN
MHYVEDLKYTENCSVDGLQFVSVWPRTCPDTTREKRSRHSLVTFAKPVVLCSLTLCFKLSNCIGY